MTQQQRITAAVEARKNRLAVVGLLIEAASQAVYLGNQYAAERALHRISVLK